MAITLELPNEYGYVLIAATSTFFLNLYHTVLDARARKAAGLKYPIAYASEELAAKDPKAFAHNCAQRAHANFTENLTPLLGALLISGLRFPLTAAGLGAGWVLSRAVYATGYVTGGPEGRRGGAGGSFLFDISLKFLALYTSVQFALGQ